MAVIGCLSFGCFSTGAEAETTLPALVRLHVLANSESLADQQVKLTVRDELLTYLTPLLQGAASQEQALQIIKAHLGELRRLANQSLLQQGENYTAQVQCGWFNFPDKHYGAFTLPAGRYQALNVTLGAGEGRNWWCVVFPPMCLTAGVCQPSDQANEQTFVLQSGILELGKRLWAWLSSLV